MSESNTTKRTNAVMDSINLDYCLDWPHQKLFQRHGTRNDLMRKIKFFPHGVLLVSDRHPDTADQLADLGVSYGERFQCLGDLETLEKSIEHYSRAFTSAPDGHPNMSHYLGSLGVSYGEQFGRLGHLEDLEKAIEYVCRALALTPDGDPDVSLWVGNLGVSYHERFQRLRNHEDLKKSIEYGSRALALTPNGQPESLKLHFIHGLSCLSQFQHTGDISDLEHSLNSFRKASQLPIGAPRDKFHYALQWAKFASQYTHSSIIEAYQTAIDLLPQFIWLGATTHQQYHDLSTIGNLAADAASAAIQSSNYSLALEWLEHARCVVWSQRLMLRSPLDQLRSSYPDLATQLKTFATQLQLNSSCSGSSFVTQTQPIPEKAGQQRIHLANEYQNLLARVRQLPGFQGFLRPAKTSKLIHAARNGPIVVINCQTDCCDALFILPEHDDIRYLPLPGFGEKMAQQARSNLETSLRYLRLRERGVKRMGQPIDKDRIGSVLSILWNGVVKPVLGYLGYLVYTRDVPTESLPHITWCPTGTLSFLPLHAAGDYSQPRSRVFDYVVSSYTPTVIALLAATPSSLGPDSKLLAIGQATTPGHNPLPGTLRELAHVKAHAYTKARYSQILDNEATTSSVLDALEHHDWVHFACHAHQSIRDPTKSGFYLHDGILDLASINRRSFSNKGLAFLSACQTATGDEKLPNEAIHLASGMLMTGYPSVIATMWSVVDDDAPLVADKVYAQLMRDGALGNGEAGRALHDAVAALREKVGEEAFGRWVPYIHIGS
ncbi:unnamed protein product [Rhizoctonia solani]|uniref:CHAT domain-containing protein n=1 Tax=Rhizoctonia solani TaxID=456999 RepID=A0A8H3DSC7_9AGAM|nr:unnamed protein product [Rhizoctonia solani]